MTEPENDYAYSSWSLEFFGKSYISYSFLRYFLASISQDMINKGRSVDCYTSRFLNDLF